MSLDTSKIGQVAAELMELLPEESDGEIIEVGIVVVVDDGEGTYTRIKSSSDLYYRQLGIFQAAISCVTYGDDQGHPEE
jgi:hypothetical protein